MSYSGYFSSLLCLSLFLFKTILPKWHPWIIQLPKLLSDTEYMPFPLPRVFFLFYHLIFVLLYSFVSPWQWSFFIEILPTSTPHLSNFITEFHLFPLLCHALHWNYNCIILVSSSTLKVPRSQGHQFGCMGLYFHCIARILTHYINPIMIQTKCMRKLRSKVIY